jgi:predicted nucleic-acid-binding protein
VKALDTNLIVRFLVRDDQVQAETVKQRLLLAEEHKEILFVPLIVLVETIWVLESAYGLSRNDILKALQNLVRMPILAFEAAPAVHVFLTRALSGSADLSDVLIGSCSSFAGCDSVLTFDRKAAQTEFFELLG